MRAFLAPGAGVLVHTLPHLQRERVGGAFAQEQAQAGACHRAGVVDHVPERIDGGGYGFGLVSTS